jgi:DNA-3-methyladenine glycosylase
LDLMRQRRGLENPVLLCSGPGRLCQALAITGDLNGGALADDPLRLAISVEPRTVTSGLRVGITKAADTPWRFGVKGSPFLSKML